MKPASLMSSLKTRPEIWVGVLAFLMRFWFLQIFCTSPIFEPLPGGNDRSLYDSLAGRVAKGEWFPPGVFEYMPLYPWVLGSLYAVFKLLGGGANLYGVGLLGAVLDSITAFLSVRLARKLGAPIFAAAVTGILYALYPVAIIYSVVTMPNTLNAFLLVMFVSACWKLEEAAGLARAESSGTGWGRRLRGVLPWFGVGLLAGVTALSFAGMLLIATLCLVFWATRQLLRRQFSVPPLAMFLLGVCLPIVPVTLHNWQAEQQFVLVTAHGGFNFYMGNHENATGYPVQIGGFRGTAGSLLADARAEAERVEGRKLTAAEFSAWWSDRAWHFIRTQPGAELRLLGLKFLKFWNHTEYDDLRLLPLVRHTNLGFTMPWWPGFGWLGWLGLAGLILARRCGFLKLVTLTGIAGVLFFFVTTRYRLTFAPLLAVCGALALDEIQRVWLLLFRRPAAAVSPLANPSISPEAEIGNRRALQSVAVVIVAGLIAVVPLTQSDFRSLDCYNTATFLMARRLPAQALDEAVQGLKISPAEPSLHFVAGNALFRLGRLREAVVAFETSLRLAPSNGTAHFNLAQTWMELREPVKAAAEAGLALKCDPADSRARELLDEARQAIPREKK